MQNTKDQQLSEKLLETARQAMDSLIEGSSEMYKATLVLKRLHDDKDFPVDSQTMFEISQMMLSMRKLLFEQKAELDLRLACIDDDKEIDKCLSQIDSKFEAWRAEVK